MKNPLLELSRSAIQTARAQIHRLIDQKIKAQTGLVSITETQPQDVFICGYPKSGNTWFQYLASGLVYGADPRYVTDTLVNDLVPDVHFRQYYRRYGRWCVFKSHFLPQPAYRRIVYLVRDGRDAMVSYYHHQQALSGPIDFLDIVKTGRGLMGKWHEHVEAFAANPYGATMIIIRYEDLKSDTMGQLRRFCSFVGIERSDDELRAIMEATKFDKMQQKEKRDGWEATIWPADKMFVRRGVVGSFRDEMPPEVLAAFMEQSERALVAHGYKTSPAAPERVLKGSFENG